MAMKFCILFCLGSALVCGQEKTIKELAAQGADAIPKIEPFLSVPDLTTRIEAVKAIIELGTVRSIDPLVKACADNDGEVQIRATDGLVNFYLPGYIKTGISGALIRAGTSVKGKFTDVNTQVIEPWVEVKPTVFRALGKIATGGSGNDARANAARALGILRGRPALDDLAEALKSRDSQTLYESMIALQKIREPKTGTLFLHLIKDLDDRVQMTAMETAGVLAAQEAAPAVADALAKAKNQKVRRMALGSLALIASPVSRPVFEQYFNDKDDQMRGSAAEGFGRLRNPADKDRIEKALQSEKKTGAKLSLSFAAAKLGHTDLAADSPVRRLLDGLDSRFFHDTAQPYLIELTRDVAVRQAIYPALRSATKKEKIRLAQILAISGDAGTVKYLEALSVDPDTEVASEGIRALRALKARLG